MGVNKKFTQFQGILSTFGGFPGKKHLKIDPPAGRGVPKVLFYPKSYFFCDLKPHTIILEPYDNSFWEKSKGPGKKKEEKTPLLVDT